MIPLSFAQQRLWFLDQLEPGSSAYNVPLLLRVEGRLEEATLARSLEEIVRRHEPLRTIFRPVEGEPEQVILPPGPVAIVWCDMRAERAEERDSLALRHARGEAMKPFDLARGPMIRFHVWRTGEEAYLLLVTMHHIASDGWSIGVFLTEMVALYDAFIEGKPSPLPEPAIRYAEYAAEQRSRLQGDLLERHAEYWKRQLTGAPSLLDLPLDFTRPAVQSTRGAQQSVEIPRELTDALKALSRKHNVTLFMTLLAAFETLLHRHSGQEDFLLGVPIAGRVRAETQGLIGFFVNTLAMRADFSGDPTLAELLRRVRRTSLESFEYQDLPFDRLVEELRPERNPAFNPLVQAMFAFENAPMPGSGAHALTLHPVRIESGTTKFDLTLTLYDEGELKGFFEYATDLFDPATIARMEGHFLTLLWGIVGDPERPVSRLPLLTEAERRTLLIEWNPQEIPPPPAATVQSLFEAQAARTPEAEALSFGGRRLTYGELNRWANRIARDLRGAGAGPEVPVVLCMSRSLEMIVAVIAIFKSGGAFVPVEPDIPRDRLAFILGETQAAVILTQESIASALPGGNARVMCIESSGPPEEPGAGANLVHEVAPDTLAYIIYTSGSTGTPKGVEITHGALAEHALETIGRYGLSGRDRVLQFSSLSFDASLEQYIPPLIAGGAVVIREGEVWGPAEAYRRVNELGITVLHMSTAYWHELAQGWSTLAPPAQFRTLRLLVAGGETMTGGSVDLWRKGPTGGIVLLNAYGPTEATIAATTYDLPAEPPGGGSFAGRRIPIGRRRGAKRLFILDTHCEPVPIGVAGELYIGGNTVSRGYRMRPELNAQAFIPDPFPGGEGRRLYRTGDRARFLSGGDIEFLGRNDFQIKIRGFRVELGEIESALAAHPAVAESVVVAAGDGGLERRLVAFVVPGGGAPARTDDLRAFLAARLPAYMVPGAFVTLDALPKTKNGKVDYRALPLPEATPAAKSTDYQAPRDALERQLVGIWEKLFGRSPIGIRDNFFDLGGHSLLAVRLFSQVERLTAKNLPLVTLFQAPTIGDLAAILRTQGWEPPWSSLVPIKPGGSRPPFYCVHGVGGNILEFEHFSRYIDPDQPLYGLQAQGLDGKRPRHSSVEEMAAHYISEIRMFQPRGPYYLGGSSFGGMVAFEMAQQLRAAGEEVGLLALFDTNAPGYPRYLPQTTKLKRWLGHARFRVELHWQNIAVADAALRREYVMAKAGRFVKQYRAKLRIKSRGLVRSISDRILPRAIRRVQQGGHDANRSYRARPYAGKVTLFRATEQPYSIIADPANGWAPYCPGGLEILDVPGHHGAIMREPRAGVLVKTLMESLTRAQSSRNGGASGKGETQ